MDCKYCGKPLISTSTLCPNCGKKNDEYSGKSENGKARSFPTLALFSMAAVLVITILSGIAASAVVEPPKIDASVASVKPGSYNECVRLTFCENMELVDKAKMYLSTDGGDFSLYDGSEIVLNETKTYGFELYCVNKYGRKSNVYSFEYEIDAPKPAPLTVNIPEGKYKEDQYVEIMSADNSSTIYYSLNGSTFEVYSGPIKVSVGDTWIKAYSVNKDGTQGDTYSWDYSVAYNNIPSGSGSNNDGTAYFGLVVTFKGEPSDMEGVDDYYLCVGSEASKSLLTIGEITRGDINLPVGKIFKLWVVSGSIRSDVYNVEVGPNGGTVYFDCTVGEGGRPNFVNTSVLGEYLWVNKVG